MLIETVGLTYKRQSIASTNSIFLDEIDMCPKDSGEDVRKTYAICEMCGMAVCSKHIIKDNDKFSCSEHTISDHGTLNESVSKKTLHHNDLEKIKDAVQSLLSQKVFNRKRKNSDVKEIDKTNDPNIQTNIESHTKGENNDNFGAPLKW